jgi:cytochrome c peroxidase
MSRPNDEAGQEPTPIRLAREGRQGLLKVIDQAAARRLGKALFWDIQAGGDGQTACASCHFLGGADDRRINTLNPGSDGTFASGGVTGPGQTFAERRVTGRNTPTMIGAVFFRDAFWDGRANHTFNGVDPFGQTANASGALATVSNAALASQAAGPPNNDVERSCAGRTFNGPGSLGTKLLARTLAGNSAALTSQQQRGLNRFQGKGNCTKCHDGALLSDASVSFFQANGALNRDGGDQGFHNLGVRPTAEDLGRAGLGPQGASFSASGSTFDRGAFKTPGLRNVKLTAPYFHNGGKATLADVVTLATGGAASGRLLPPPRFV